MIQNIIIFPTSIIHFAQIALPLLIVGAFFSCEPNRIATGNGTQEIKRVVKGKIEEFPRLGKILLYQINKDTEILIDTVSLQPSGRFYVEFYTKAAGIYKLNFFDSASVEFVVAENTLDLTVRNFKDDTPFIFNRSLENRVYHDYLSVKEQVLNQRNRLSGQGKLSAYGREIDKIILSFYEDNASFYSALLSLELLATEAHETFLLQQLEQHKNRFEKTEAWQHLSERLKPFKQLKAEAVAPQFALVNVKDSTIFLSDFRGNAVLLNFTANWCLQCPEIEKQLTNWQQTRFKKGDSVHILHIALDTKHEEWKQSVESVQQPKQVHLITPNSWESKAVEDYNVQALPLLCLVDSSGKIQTYDVSVDSLRSEFKAEAFVQ